MSERRELTEEEREKLLGYFPFSIDATTEFTPEIYLQKENDVFLIPDGYRPVFTLRPLDKVSYDKAAKIQLEAGLSYKNDVAGHPSSGNTMLEKQQGVRDIVRAGVVGWQDYIDIGTGKEIQFASTEDVFNKMPFAIVTEIFMHLLKISGLLPGERLGLK